MIISELKVLKSSAGWYVGRTYTDTKEEAFDFPYSRDSEYFRRKEDAQSYLSYVADLEKDDVE